jgi:glutaredoxin-like protein
MLAYLNPKAKAPDFVTLFTRPGCPHCARAKKALAEHGHPWEEIVLGKDVTTRSLRAVTGKGTVPQVYVGGRHIGGADELEQYLKAPAANAA